MAESVFTELVHRAGRAGEFVIDSAATSTEEIGNPPHHGTVAKLFSAGCGRINDELVLAPGPAHEVLHHELGHRRPADVAVAYKENAVDGLEAIHDQLSPNEAKYDALSNGVPRL